MNRRPDPVIVAILAFAVVLIGWGIWRIPPHQLNGDEWSVVAKSLLMLFHEPVMPRFRKGGNMHMRLLAFAYLPLVAYWAVTGQLPTVVRESSVYSSEVPLDPGPMLTAFYEAVLAGRVVSVLAAVGVVYLVFRLATELADRRAGILAALTLTASVGFVTISKFSNEDAPQMFLVVLTLLLLVYAVSDRSPRYLLFASVMFGLAVSMKATSGLLLAPMALAVSEIEWRPKRSIVYLAQSGGLYGLAAATAYFATTPSALVFPSRWATSVLAYLGFSITTLPVSAGHTVQNPGWAVLTVHLAQSLGIALFIVAIASASVAAWGVYRRRYDRRLLLVLAFGAAYVLVLTTPRMPQYPRMMLLHPILAICVGVVGADALSIDVQRWSSLAGPVLVGVLALSTASTVVFVADFGTSRADATEWAAEHVEDGATVDVYSYRVYRPEFRDGVRVNDYFLSHPSDPAAREIATDRVDRACPRYIAMTSYYYQRFLLDETRFPGATELVRDLLGGDTAYRPVATFGPPVTTDFSLEARARRSAEYPPVWLRGDANPTIVVLERSAGSAPQCRGKS